MTHADSSTSKSDSPQQREAAKAFAISAARLLADNQCTETVVLDLKGKSPVADFW